VFEVVDSALRPVGVAIVPPATPRRVLPSLSRAAAAAALRNNVSPDLIDIVARQESGYRANAVSKAGAIGVMQLMPATARALRVDPHDPIDNIEGGARYLRMLLDRFGGRVDLTLAAYNAGPAAVDRYGGIPPYRETRAYVAAGLARLAERSAAQINETLGIHP
jgi:soluble lytic murein transglycosylase-like protein